MNLHEAIYLLQNEPTDANLKEAVRIVLSRLIEFEARKVDWEIGAAKQFAGGELA